MQNKKLVIILIIIVLALIIALGVAIVYVKGQKDKNNKLEANKSLENVEIEFPEEEDENAIINNNNNETSDNPDLEDATKQLEVNAFNLGFEAFTNSQSVNASSIRELFSIIEKTNKENEIHKVELDDSGITDVMSVQTNMKYKVELFKDDEGYVHRIRITEIKEENEQVIQQKVESDLDKAKFNSKFIAHDQNGEIDGSKISSLINDVISSNNQNPNHFIDVQSESISTEGIDEGAKYSILLKYDDNGWINLIILEKKN